MRKGKVGSLALPYVYSTIFPIGYTFHIIAAEVFGDTAPHFSIYIRFPTGWGAFTHHQGCPNIILSTQAPNYCP